MFKFKLKSIFELYKKPSHLKLAYEELEDAKRDLLASQTAKAYAEAAVEFNNSQVERLTAYLNYETREKSTTKK